LTSNAPGLGSPRRGIEIEGKPIDNPEQPPQAAYILQSPAYLPAIGLPLLMGRPFNEADGEKGKEAAIVTREFAARYWPNETALGKRFRFFNKQNSNAWMTVIGVSADIVQNQQTRDEPTPPLVYLPQRQDSWSGMTVLLRTSADPNSLAVPLRTALQKIDQDLPLFEARTLTASLDRQRWFLTVFGTLFSVFAMTALLMASVGIYAVVAQSTVRRTREIGIRMALGATADGIVRLVLSRGMVQLGLGLVLGLGGAFAATGLLKNAGFLIQVSPNDPLVFALTTVVLIAIGVFACWLPARRAARVDPTHALRTD
jgi:putative ABC transport system permease protein